MNLVAPAGTPISFNDIQYWLSQIFSKNNTLEEFQEAICHKFNIKHCLFMSSGRAALTLVLQALAKWHSNDNKNEIIIPSYTCYSVPASIIKAGLKIRVCDIDPSTLSYDINKLSNFDFTRILAIVSANLYGIPNDLLHISAIARKHGVYLVDDAAQCMGGKVSNQYSGTFGDVGLYSLDKGKNITSIQGGILVTNSDELAQILNELIHALPSPAPLATMIDSLKLLIYAALLPPYAYWITQYLPFLHLGKTIYTTEYPVRQYSCTLGGLALKLFRRLDEINNIRIERANLIANTLKDLPGLSLFYESAGIKPVYVRYPLLINDQTKREHIIKALSNNGICASTSYPLAITDIPEIQNLLNFADKDNIGGRRIANEILTLPTHPYVTEKHIETIANTIRCVLAK